MRTRIGLLGGVLVLLIGAGVAALAYQAGLTQGAANTAAGASVVVVGGPWAFGGFHLIGILFGLFFLFLVARVVIGIAFWRGGGPWGPGRGRGHWGPGGPGWGDRGPGGPWADRDAFLSDVHRRLHEREAAAAAGAPGATGTATSTAGTDPASGA